MYIVTFYSFRGGVGRTTALVNIGMELARRGRKVLLVDFDLESPSLAGFPLLARPERQLGVVEFVSAYRENGFAPDVMKYRYSLGPVGTKGGRIWVMPAGKGGPEYWKALAEIDWQTLYEYQEGYLFFEDTREQWRSLKPDYVLIDTHAGITPPLGITTRQLADAVVMMVNSQRRGWDGLDEVSWLIAQEAERTGRKPIGQLFVAAKVVEADDNPGADYENDAGIFTYAAAIPFSHRVLLGEQVIEQEKREDENGWERRWLSQEGLAKEYRKLANAIIMANFAGDADGARVVLADIHRQTLGAI